MQDVKFENIVPRTNSMAKMQELQFERQKNTKAFLYTLGVVALFFLLFTMIKWEKPMPELPLKEDLVSVNLDDINLGNDLNGGYGEVQPLVKGDFAPPDAGNPQPKSAPSESKEEPADPETNDNNNDDAPTIDKPVVKPTNPSRNITPATTTKPTPNVTPNNAPPAPKPKVGGPWKRPNGTGTGNGADVDNGFRNQGNGQGTGDQGNPFGTPTGTGQRLSNANLRNKSEIERLTSQSGTNYKGKVSLTLRVDDAGNVSSIISNSPSPASREAKSFANDVAYKMKFPSGADGRTAKIVLDFDF